MQKTAYFLISIVLGAVTLREGAFLLVPLVWGVFFAFALNPISNWFERKKLPRSLAIVLSILLVSLVAFGVFYALLGQMVGLIRDIPEIGQSLETKLNVYLEEVSLLLGKEILTDANSEELLNYFKPENLNNTLFATGKSLTLAGIIPLYIFLLMYYKDFFVEFLIRFSSKNKDRVLDWAVDSGKVIQLYLSGMIRVTGIVAVLAGLFFYLIDVKYFLLFAAFIAVMNLIPYVGVFISSFFGILYVFLTTDSMIYPLLTFGVLWGIQLLENNIITPLIVGSQVKVNALAVVLAILLGGWLWGISGMVLFIPLVGVLKITLERTVGLEAFGYLLSDDLPKSQSSGWSFSRIFRRTPKENK
ncbi:AI-2E family transporter [Algoriphagus hitonicola]|uniref:Predicted PurR-regulated permease PerM n=1 Tax=Algoriphagus hitonicola TaxID=435880 RepID=A0A1I2TDS9_9BACT|nr:AI-2E family transporter [Algoriphagus hitonicola]SFG61497.1 Predicted PurR-regulated permease PerM [Algoriphagus hitonicola]